MALVELRAHMLAAMGVAVGGPEAAWRLTCQRQIAARLASEEPFAAFVVDGDAPGELAAGAVAWVDVHLCGVDGRDGVGYIANVSTLPPYRRQGLGRRVTAAAVTWLTEETDVRRIDLHATEQGEPIYRALGFVEHTQRPLTLPIVR